MASLSFGLQLPVQAQSRTFAEKWEHDADVEDMLAVARTADRLGYRYLAVCDHPVIGAHRVDWEGTTWFDPMTTLAYIAAVTKQIRLLTHVLVLPLRHPLLVAKAASTLDVLSGGRLLLGVGAGYAADEFAAVGADHANRGRVTDDAIVALRAAFTDEFPEVRTETFTFDGSLGARPRPVQPGGPPVWVGGSSERALSRAARLADGWFPQGEPLQKARPMIDRVRELRSQTDRGPIEIGVYAHVRIGTDGPPARISGKPGDVAAAFEGHQRAGVDHVQVRFASTSRADLEEQLETFAADVLPLLEVS